jgi:transposase
MAQTASPVVNSADRERLAAIVEDRNRPQKHAQRAMIILLSAERLTVLDVAARSGASRPSVWRWQQRFAEEGVAGLLRDRTRKPGKAPLPPAIIARVLALPCGKPPKAATHWTGRMVADAVGVSLSAVQRIWRAHRLQPHRIRTFKKSNDPAFAAKVEDIVGLYMNPPAHAVVVSIDEKRSYGVIATRSLRVRLQPLTLEATHVSYKSPSRSAGHYSNGSWRDFRVDGTESHELAAHVTIARRRGKDVEACVAQRRCR